MAKAHRTDPRLIDLTGKRFGKLTVLEMADRVGQHQRWLCRCDCGKTLPVIGKNLRCGASRSCGCAHLKQGGLSTTREYAIWSKMLLRCYREENDNYRFYGAKGVYVCRRWRESFTAFFEDMGQVPSRKHSLDRKNSEGSYTCGKCEECRERGQPANCRWVTKAVQARNQRSNRYYTHDGKTLILKDWARLTGIKYLTLWNRLKSGMPFEVAITPGHFNNKELRRLLPGRPGLQ